MIHKITIENFFSIADRQEISFEVPGNAPDLSCFRRPLPAKKLRLPVAIGLFGPNASGKSTVLRAIFSTIIFACKSYTSSGGGVLFQTYRRKDWMNEKTKISIDFDASLDGKISSSFRYELHIGHTNLQTKDVSFESLMYAPKGKLRNIFERKGNEYHFSDEFYTPSKNDSRVTSIRSDASLLSAFDFLNHPLSKNICEQIWMQICGFDYSTNILDWYNKDKNLIESLNKFIRRLDVGIESMFIEQGPQGLYAKFKHVDLDDFILMGEESAGTQKFIHLFPRIHYALQTGQGILVDELDTHFHPSLFSEILNLFADVRTNPKNAQLFFTAQNPILLDELEKEQIYFTEKLTGKPTVVYGARDIEGLRRSPSLMKKYLSGELGAVPHIG